MTKTNVEFVVELMEESKHGALTQIFVIEALRYYSLMIAEWTPSDKEMASTLLNPLTWKEIGEEISIKLAEKYNKGT